MQWVGTFGSFFLLFQATLAIVVSGAEYFAGLAASVLAAIAAVLALIWVRRLTKAGVRDVAFIKATTTARLIAVAWLLVLIAIISGTIVGVIWRVEAETLDWTAGIVSVLGTASLIAMVGPGYTEYREGLSHLSRTRHDAAEANPAG